MAQILPFHFGMKTENTKILIIDDEQYICDSCRQVYLKDGYQVDIANDGLTGIKKIKELKPDLVLVDLKMPGMNGMQVLEEMKKNDPTIVSVVITGYATIDSAVEAMKRDAFDFLPKPFTPNELRLVTRRALKKRQLVLETNRLREEKDRMRENFISMVSHQLRTPLVAVQQYFEVILGGMVGTVSQEQQEILNRSKIRIDDLIKLIKEWLDYAKIDANKLIAEIKPTNLSTILSKIFATLQPLAKQNNVILKMDVPGNLPLISGSANTLEQVFLNLVENGIRYNKDEGNVTITAGTENRFVKVEISDTGIGISQQVLPFIFEQFYQVNPHKRTDGTGLGLCIVKRIIDAHFGEIRVTSELGRGTVFSILLPEIKEEQSER